jgi:hypothetical protein
MKKYYFLMFMICLSALVIAQSKVQVRIKKEVNGKVQVETKDFILQPGQDLNDALIENGIDKSGAQEFSISIEENNFNGNTVPRSNVPFDMFSQIPFEQMPSHSQNKPYLGITLKNDEEFPIITDIQRQSPADHADLRIGDQILKIDNEKMESAQDVVAYIQTKQPHDEVVLKIKRHNKTMKLCILLSSLPNPGFSFPFDPQAPILDFQPMDIDSLFESPKAFLGVVPSNDMEEESGVKVDSVLMGSSASNMGIQKGDIIIAINGNAVADFEGLRALVGQAKPGTPCEATVIRNGKTEVLEGVFGSKNMIIKDGYRIYQNDKGLDDQGNINLDFELDWNNGLLDSLFTKEISINMDTSCPQLVIKNYSPEQLKIMGKAPGELEQISYIPNGDAKVLDLQFSQTKPFTYRVIIEDSNEGILYSDERLKPVTECKKSISYESWNQGEYALKIFCNDVLVIAQRLILQ